MLENTKRWELDFQGQSAFYDFGSQPIWDNIEIELLGDDAINFEKFIITCDNEKHINLVNKDVCESIWFDPFDPANSMPCYSETSSKIKTGVLGKY